MVKECRGDGHGHGVARGLGVGVGLGIGVGAGVEAACTSNEPLSMRPFLTR
jgi:hypothetical protein